MLVRMIPLRDGPHLWLGECVAHCHHGRYKNALSKALPDKMLQVGRKPERHHVVRGKDWELIRHVDMSGWDAHPGKQFAHGYQPCPSRYVEFIR